MPGFITAGLGLITVHVEDRGGNPHIMGFKVGFSRVLPAGFLMVDWISSTTLLQQKGQVSNHQVQLYTPSQAGTAAQMCGFLA